MSSMERQFALGGKLNPTLLDSFLAALEKAATQARPLVNFKLPAKQNISSATLLIYLR